MNLSSPKLCHVSQNSWSFIPLLNSRHNLVAVFPAFHRSHIDKKKSQFALQKQRRQEPHSMKQTS